MPVKGFVFSLSGTKPLRLPITLDKIWDCVSRGIGNTQKYNIIQKAISEKKGSVSADTVKTILEQKVPKGVFCPYYEDGMGHYIQWCLMFLKQKLK